MYKYFVSYVFKCKGIIHKRLGFGRIFIDCSEQINEANAVTIIQKIERYIAENYHYSNVVIQNYKFIGAVKEG